MIGDGGALPGDKVRPVARSPDREGQHRAIKADLQVPACPHADASPGRSAFLVVDDDQPPVAQLQDAIGAAADADALCQMRFGQPGQVGRIGQGRVGRKDVLQHVMRKGACPDTGTGFALERRQCNRNESDP